MNGLIEVKDVFGTPYILNLQELDTRELLPCVGGCLVIKLLNICDPSIPCTQQGCYELADVVVLNISRSGEAGDTICQVCFEHLEDLRLLVTKEAPFRSLN